MTHPDLLQVRRQGPNTKPDHAALALRKIVVGSDRLKLAAAAGLSLGASVGAMIQPRILQDAINVVTSGGPPANTVATLVVVAVITAILSSMQTYSIQWAAESVASNLRLRVSRRYLRMSMRAHDSSSSADLQSRAILDINLIKSMIAAGIVPVLGSGVLLMGISYFMFVIDAVLFSITASAVVVGVFVIGVCGPPLRNASRSVQESSAAYNQALLRDLSAFRTIKSFGAEDNEFDRISLFVQQIKKSGLRLALIQSGVQPILNLLFQAVIIAVIIVGATRVASSSLDIGGLFAFIMYLFLLSAPISGIGQSFTQLQIGKAALYRLGQVDSLAVEKSTSEDCNSSDGLPIQRYGQPILHFDDVSFGYEESVTVLREMTFSIFKGERLAIVGGSGAGKTTVLELLLRFYSPQNGEVTFSGVGLDRWNLAEYRRNFATLNQEKYVISGSLRENLTLGVTQISDSYISSILSEVGLGELLARPGGLDAGIGEDGVDLSGGQRQRLAWARVLSSSAEILLLDEPTASLDTISNERMFALLDKYASDKTIILITHRISQAMRADRIMVIERGFLRGIGSHKHLSDTVPYYRSLVDADTDQSAVA